jgi:hypothetical protein
MSGSGNSVVGQKKNMEKRRKTESVLRACRKLGFIDGFCFTPPNGKYDITGIDIFIFFNGGYADSNGDPHGNYLAAQELSTNSENKIKRQFRLYPDVPVFVIRRNDGKKKIRCVFLMLFLATGSYNPGKESEITNLLRRSCVDKCKIGYMKKPICDGCCFPSLVWLDALVYKKPIHLLPACAYKPVAP